MDIPYDKRYSHPAALSSSRYGATKMDLLRTNFHWQVLLMKRNMFIYVFKFIQVKLRIQKINTVVEHLMLALITTFTFLKLFIYHTLMHAGIFAAAFGCADYHERLLPDYNAS